MLFLSTPSGWRATAYATPSARTPKNFYPRPPGGGRPFLAKRHRDAVQISIHALRVEGDILFVLHLQHFFYFYPRPPGGGRPLPQSPRSSTRSISIHALRVEGDVYQHDVNRTIFLFLSTPSGWRATGVVLRRLVQHLYFYPRPPGGGRHVSIPPIYTRSVISIHALRVEGDFWDKSETYIDTEFLSTPSGWRATAKTDKVFICFCAKGRRICLFKTRKEKICRWRFKKDKFWVLIWCEGSGKSVCALASHCG